MIIKYSEFIKENEFTKLGTHFMGKIVDEFGFTQPNDNVSLKYCNITFPDGVKIKFDMELNINSDTETIIIKPIKNHNYENIPISYINLYGDKLQFEDHESFRRIRLYMNKEDLFDTSFSGYIYSDGKLGSIEVDIEIDKDISDRIINNSLLKKGIFNGVDSIIMELIISISTRILKSEDSINNFKKSIYEFVHKFIEYIESFNNRVRPIDIILQKDIGLIGFLYLYTILNEESEEVIEIISNPFTFVNKDELLGILYSI